MKDQFYSHIVRIDVIYTELDAIEMSEEERDSLKKLVDSNMHHTIIDSILSELTTEDKKIFLEHLAKRDHAKIWKHITGKIVNIEKKLKKTGEELLQDFLRDIKEVKSKIS